MKKVSIGVLRSGNKTIPITGLTYDEVCSKIISMREKKQGNFKPSTQVVVYEWDSSNSLSEKSRMKTIAWRNTPQDVYRMMSKQFTPEVEVPTPIVTEKKQYIRKKSLKDEVFSHLMNNFNEFTIYVKNDKVSIEFESFIEETTI